MWHNLSRDYFFDTKMRFLAAILKQILLMYDCFKCINIWYKFRTETSEKYSKMVESKWTLSPAKQDLQVS